ncbi:MAG: Gfo/Idh/MocA family oxidoreductase [Pseudomonadales bacterium]|nr:Gfo/Idh/MocA family oxidoreductase [Pseudomonadales bacterium]
MTAGSVRLGIIGLGNMGQTHCRLVARIPDITLTAVCDIDPARLEKMVAKTGARGFRTPGRLLASGICDAVLIATPHYGHTTIGKQALKHGLHVLVEKPISVHKADCEKLIAAHQDEAQVFAAMFNQRTNAQYQRIREMVRGGELGAVRRVHWAITDWFRSQAYYDSGGWRATWAHEGGGVLMNQCPHQLDLLQWIFGMPSALQAFCHLGKHHRIEVEDDVTCYLEYPDGATGVFTTTTGEAPGVNRLEIAAENGLLVHDAQQGTLTFTRNDKPVTRAIAENEGFKAPSTDRITIDIEDTGRQHAEILENFASAILHGTPLIAHASEGIHSVELANAMLYSSWTGKRVELPLDSARYARRLKRQIRESTFVKQAASGVVATDMDESF